MSLGDLFTQADVALREAAEYLRSGVGPVDTVDVLTAVTARSAVYSGLARCVRVVAGGAVTIETADRPRVEVVALAQGLMGERGQHANTLYAVLRAAADSGGFPPATLARSAGTERLVRSADVIGAAGDLLAGHAPPGGPPRTREGLAIRHGGAARAGLATIAALTMELVRVDAQLPGWLAAGGPAGLAFAEQYPDALRAPRWTVDAGLGALADVLRARAVGAPDIAALQPAPPEATHMPADSRDPLARLAAVERWLRERADLVDAQHLRAGTRLGLAVSLLAADRPPVNWRTAMTSAMQLNSPPASGQARYVAAELGELTAAVRDRLPSASTPETVALAGMLPALAEALRRGLAAGVRRGGLLVAQAGLSLHPVRLIYRYQTTARPATARDSAVSGLRAALAAAADHALQQGGGERSRSTALAFPHPPRPGNGPAPVASSHPGRPAQGRTRHR